MSEVHVAPSTVEDGELVLTPEAIDFVASLQRTFGARRDELIATRPTRHAELAANGVDGASFRPETAHIRDDRSWRVAAAPPALNDRRTEITGPTERKMAINALNSGAHVWLADLEDANTPHWNNVVSGQVNLRDAIRGTISFTSPEGRLYELQDNEITPTIVVRPRGWHLEERHFVVDGAAVVGCFVDFGLHFFHNAKELLARGSGPYFYLPKMESYLEARLWAEVFAFAEAQLGVEHGTIRATVLIETIPAAFEMEEILYELRDYASGLNAGRWDYLFSIIKVFRAAGPEFLVPDRNAVTMTSSFMRSYTELLVSTCHQRGAFAIGGMAAFIPNRRDPEVNAVAMAKVHADKNREAGDGFDGSWVAHPDLVPICDEEFGAVLGDRPNQLDRLRDDVHVEPAELVRIPHGPGDFTVAGLHSNIGVGLRYLAAWLDGNGAVAIYNLMEDAATAEISRSQVWQWVNNAVELEDGTITTPEFVGQVIADEIAKAKSETTDPAVLARLDEAAELFTKVALGVYVDFLTSPAYELID